MSSIGYDDEDYWKEMQAIQNDAYQDLLHEMKSWPICIECGQPVHPDVEICECGSMAIAQAVLRCPVCDEPLRPPAKHSCRTSLLTVVPTPTAPMEVVR